MSKGAVLALAGLIAALALVAGGCGGGGGDSTSSVTKVQFVNKVDGLCEEREQERASKIQAVGATLKPGENLSAARQARLIARIVVPSYAKMIENVESLEPPSGDEDVINELLKAMEKAQQKVEADPRQAVYSTVMFVEADRIAKKYGLIHCRI